MSRLDEIIKRKMLIERGINEGILNPPLLDDFVWLIQQAQQNINKDEIISRQRKQIKDMTKKLEKQRHTINGLGGGKK